MVPHARLVNCGWHGDLAHWALRVREGWRHRKSAAWHRMAQGYRQSAAWSLGATVLIERADVCFDSSFVSTCHVCLEVQLWPFLQRLVWTRKCWSLLVLMADPEKKTDKNRLFCLCLPLSSLCPPRYNGAKWSKRLQGAVVVEPDMEGVYCSVIKQNKKLKYAVWRRALAYSRGEQSRGPELGNDYVWGPSCVCVHVPIRSLWKNSQVIILHLIYWK